MSVVNAAWRLRRPQAPLPTPADVFVLALAAERLARAVSVDEITNPLRRRVAAAAGRPTRVGRCSTWLQRLLDCPLCTGWWISLGVSLVAPGRHKILRGFAVAGGQSMLALGERLVSEAGRAAVHDANRAEERNDSEQE